MKRNRWKITVAAIAAAVLLAACGSKEEPEVTAVQEPVEERVEKVEPEEAAEPVEEPEEIEEPEEEQPEWVTAYKEFLSDRENLVPLLLEEGEGGLRGYITGFYLHDLNGDDVPELFVQKEYVADYIYTFVDSHIELRNAMEYNPFGEAYFGFDKRDGQAYSFELSVGTGTDRGTNMSKVTLMETSHDMEKTVGVCYIPSEGLETVCSVVQEEAYQSEEWEAAVFDDEQLKDLGLNFVPFDFHEITDENIETYITAAYADVVEPCSLEAYREKAENRREAFWDTGFFCEVRDGGYVMPETAREVDDWGNTAYYDTALLTCFRAEDRLPKFEGDWKQAYREFLENIDTAIDNDGNPVMPDVDYTALSFYDWERTEAPVLMIDNGMVPWTRNYFAVLDGEVVNIGAEYRLAMGASESWLINEGDYYIERYMFGAMMDFYGGRLYKIKHGKPELAGSIEWQEVDEYSYEDYGEDYVPEHGFDNPDCLLYGESVSKQEFMSEVDQLLGNGAAEQLLAVVKGHDGGEDVNETEGPLSFAKPLLMEGFTLEQMIDMMDTP